MSREDGATVVIACASYKQLNTSYIKWSGLASIPIKIYKYLLHIPFMLHAHCENAVDEWL